MQAEASEVIECDHEDEQHQEETAGLVIEEQAGEEQEGVAQQDPVAQQAQEGEHDGQERPEIELGEQQRMRLVESEQVAQEILCHCHQSIHHRSDFK